ncbi:MAG: hypothetical protein ACFN0Y_03165 [Lactobacillus sp.]
MPMKNSYFPVIYGVLSAFLGFVAVFFVCQRSFHLNLQVNLLVSGLCALVFFVWSYFRGHASSEIKRITAKYKLTDQDLAKITGLKASDFPIYHNKLQLILPKRQWPRVFAALQAFEKKQES